MKAIINIYHKYEEIINYLIVGALTTLVSLVTYYLCTFAFLDPNVALELQIANVISWVCSVIFAFVTNRVFVFKSKNKKVLKEVSSFVASRLVTLFMDMGLMFLGVTVLKLNDKIIKLVVQVIVIVLNYILSKIFVFKKQG